MYDYKKIFIFTILLMEIPGISAMNNPDQPPVPPNSPSSPPKDDTVEIITKRLFVTVGNIGDNLEKMKRLLKEDASKKITPKNEGS